MQIRFYDSADDALLAFAVIATKSGGKWVFCRHRARESWELPGGHREAGESILAAAERELRKETGALDFSLTAVCVYSAEGKNRVNSEGGERFGVLCAAEIFAFDPTLHCEIEEVRLFDGLPERWTYPLIQLKLLAEVERCER